MDLTGAYWYLIPNLRVSLSVLGGGFKHFLFLPLHGDMIQFDKHIFQLGGNHHLL